MARRFSGLLHALPAAVLLAIPAAYYLAGWMQLSAYADALLTERVMLLESLPAGEIAGRYELGVEFENTPVAARARGVSAVVPAGAGSSMMPPGFVVAAPALTRRAAMSGGVAAELVVSFSLRPLLLRCSLLLVAVLAVWGALRRFNGGLVPKFVAGAASEESRLKRVALDLQQRNALLEQARRKAQEAADSKAVFLATMSHEIRTPMNAVVGMAGLLQHTQLSQEQKDYVQTIRMSADSLLTIINDILDFSKIESGRIDLEMVGFDVAEMVDDVIDLVAVKAREQSTGISCVIEDGVPARVCGDLTRIRQVLLNLCSNAVKFTSMGRVRIDVRFRAGAEGRAFLEFSVSDTGVGIPAKALETLFEPFTQGDCSTTRRYGGTGLGLAICARLVEMMGGRIFADSAEGSGSRFTFDVLVSPDEDARPVAVATGLEGRRVLMVDEAGAELALLTRNCLRHGMAVHSFGKLRDALDWLRGVKPVDAIVAALDSGDMDPRKLSRTIRELAGHEGLPLILLTRNGGHADVQPEEGAFTACLAKPVRSSVLMNILARTMLGKAAAAHDHSDVRTWPRTALQVLVADDNDTNGKLAVRVLKRLGIRADVAASGIEVLAALERQRYAVILMDMQMPEMDGLECARRIRSLYGASGPRIVALTANAMAGDRERCLASGMDDYVAKPYSEQQLADALGLQPEGGGEVELIGNVLDPDSVSMLRTLYEDDVVALEELIASFIARFPAEMAEIEAAAGAADFSKLALRAHKLKGTAGAFGARGLADAASRLELVAREGERRDVTALIDELLGCFELTHVALRELAYVHKLATSPERAAGVWSEGVNMELPI